MASDSTATATIRVVLATHRRPHLLPRALSSLRAQTFADWVCHLHNDAPDDVLPECLVRATGDPRILYVHHPENWGLTNTLNSVFDEGPEPFVALLEDDNWWEPQLLESLLTALKANPEADIAWSNMNLWREESGGAWKDLHTTIWPVPKIPGIRRFDWPQPEHVLGHLHSNGAMLVRRDPVRDYRIPSETVPGSTEAIRERAFPFPLLLVEQPLANFAVTLRSARSAGQIDFFQQQVLLAASFFRHVSPGWDYAQPVWEEARHGPARTLHALIIGALVSGGGTQWLRFAGISDWLWFAAWAIRHPIVFQRALRARSEMPKLWEFLDRHTSLKVHPAIS